MGFLFSAAHWLTRRYSGGTFMKKTRFTAKRIVINAVLIALYIVLGFIKIPIGNILRINMASFAVVMCAVMYSPIDGLIVGFLAHKVFKLSQEKERKIPIAVATVISCAGGMAFNIVADPLLGYYYKMYVLGVPQQAADIWAKMGAVTTAVNAVIAVIAATVFYLALRPALKRTKMLPQL
jgi:uncharacterized membrane protein